MQNFQDTLETRKAIIYQCFFNLHDYTFKRLRVAKEWRKMVKKFT